MSNLSSIDILKQPQPDLFVGALDGGICATPALLRRIAKACLEAADSPNPKVCVPVSMWRVRGESSNGSVQVSVMCVTRMHEKLRIAYPQGMLHASDVFEMVRTAEQLHYDYQTIEWTQDTDPDFSNDAGSQS